MVDIPRPPITSPKDYLHDVEEFLEMYGRGLEWRTRFNALAFLAQQISLDPHNYQEFSDVLREASHDPNCRLDIVFNKYSGALAFVGIKSTFAPPDWGKRGKGSSADWRMAEEAQANYYLAQFEISQLKAQAEKLRDETGEARAAVRTERDRADALRQESTQLRLELLRLRHVKKTDDDVKRLSGELASLQRKHSQLESDHADLTQRLTQVGDSYQQYREGREHHVCEVGGLRLLKTMTCGCLILADHRLCTGALHMRIEKDTSFRENDIKLLRPQPEGVNMTEAEAREFFERVGKGLNEQLHLALDPEPVIDRLRPGRFAMRSYEGGARNLRRGIIQLCTDSRPDQRRLSTHVVRPVGDL